MTRCRICNSPLITDIENMISKGANEQYIKDWASERSLTISLKAIQTHKDLHLKYVEQVKVKVSDSEAVYLTAKGGERMTLATIEKTLDVEYEQLLSYFSTNNIKVNRRKTYDVIEIMRHLTNLYRDEADSLKNQLELMLPKNEKQALAQLKQQKLEAQTRLLTAVANIKEVQLQQAIGELVTNKELEEKWSYSLVGFKAKLESIPNKLALELSSITNKSNVENVLIKLINEALEELDNGS